MKNKKAIIAMSGGVDSSVAAHLMTQSGYDCVGIMMKLYDNEEADVCSGKTCCTEADAEDARNVASKVGIPFYVFNFKDDFEEAVIRRFVDTYIRGETPNPCIDCNRYIKFQRLMQRMHELDYDYVVTGHYARITYDEESGRYLLKKSVDESKDQSYVLYSLTQEQLSHTLFPLGEYRKSEIREMAEEQGFINARKHDSQDICFVPDGDYAAFLEHYCGQTFEPGEFVSVDGKVLGQHKGIVRYTIGQRRGLGISSTERIFVCDKDMEHNRVILGSKEYLFKDTLTAYDVNLISVERIEQPMRCRAKIRYKHPEAAATVEQISDTEIKVVFDEPQRGIAPGQAVVLYEGDVVIGGGTIR